jgi:hypothetical protein
MKTRWLVALLLLLCISCSDNPDNHLPALQITDVDVSLPDQGVYKRNPDQVIIYNTEYQISIFIHIYNETPVRFEALEVYDEQGQLYFSSTFEFTPSLYSLTNIETERWTVGWYIYLLNGSYPVGNYIAYVWITDDTGRDSFVKSFELIIVEEVAGINDQPDLKVLCLD